MHVQGGRPLGNTPLGGWLLRRMFAVMFAGPCLPMRSDEVLKGLRGPQNGGPRRPLVFLVRGADVELR
jgi:hypothetical protein